MSHIVATVSNSPYRFEMSSADLELTKRPEGGAIDIESLKRRSWPGITAHFVRFATPLTYDFKVDKSSSYIALHDFYRVDGETFVEGLPRSYVKDMRNRMTFIPRGCEIEGWTQLAKVGTFTALHLEQTAGSRQTTDIARLLPQVAFEDQALRMTMLRFQAILHDPTLDLPGYAETLGELIAYEINRVASQRPRKILQQGGLTVRQVRVVTDYMDSHLTEKTTISELAALVDLTRFHFIRSFRQTAGVPPHQFMIRRRVDRAKELLLEQDTPITDVAAKTGFNSAVQLTRAFRRIVGTTPSKFRRDAS
jgi:AraC family transcriptional regulator